MLFRSDSQLELLLTPSNTLKNSLLVAVLAALMLCMPLLWLGFLFVIPLILLIAMYILLTHMYFLEKSPLRVSRMVITKGVWEIRKVNGTLINPLYLSEYYLGSQFLKLKFKRKQKSVFSRQFEILIFPDQIGESGFRELKILLEFEHELLRA